uniref:Uncharacterized protein n=1 Tax=Anopheles coluzzii TaxID=1518534 RepID=A0A8W7P4N0_ANOCL
LRSSSCDSSEVVSCRVRRKLYHHHHHHHQDEAEPNVRTQSGCSNRHQYLEPQHAQLVREHCGSLEPHLHPHHLPHSRHHHPSAPHQKLCIRTTTAAASRCSAAASIPICMHAMHSVVSVRETHHIAQAQQEKNAKLREAFGISQYFVEGTSFDQDRKAKEDLAKSEALQKELAEKEKAKEMERANRKRYALVRTPSPEKEAGGGGAVAGGSDRNGKQRRRGSSNDEREEGEHDDDDEEENDGSHDGGDGKVNNSKSTAGGGLRRDKEEKKKKKKKARDV